jgi:diphthine synthase
MMCVGVARIGQSSQKIVAGSLQELSTVDFGPPLHSLIICGELHPVEREYLSFYKVKPSDHFISTSQSNITSNNSINFNKE